MQTSEQLALSSPWLLHRAFSFPPLSCHISLFFFFLSYILFVPFVAFPLIHSLHQTYPVSLEFLPLSRERNTVWFIQPLCTVCWIVKFFPFCSFYLLLFSFFGQGWKEERRSLSSSISLLFFLLRFRLPFSITMLSNISQLRRFMGNYKDTECVSVAWWLTWLNFYCRRGQDFFLFLFFFLIMYAFNFSRFLYS